MAFVARAAERLEQLRGVERHTEMRDDLPLLNRRPPDFGVCAAIENNDGKSHGVQLQARQAARAILLIARVPDDDARLAGARGSLQLIDGIDLLERPLAVQALTDLRPQRLVLRYQESGVFGSSGRSWRRCRGGMRIGSRILSCCLRQDLSSLIELRPQDIGRAAPLSGSSPQARCNML